MLLAIPSFSLLYDPRLKKRAQLAVTLDKIR